MMKSKILPADKDGYARLLKVSKDIFDIGFEKLADQPFTRFTTMLKQIPALLKLKSYMTVAQLVNSYIRHPLLRQAFRSIPCWLAATRFQRLRSIR